MVYFIAYVAVGAAMVSWTLISDDFCRHEWLEMSTAEALAYVAIFLLFWPLILIA